MPRVKIKFVDEPGGSFTGGKVAQVPSPIKRSDQRRRRNAEEGVQIVQAPSNPNFAIPAPGLGWHPMAVQFYDAMNESGQSVFFELTDWVAAWAVCESMSRAFNAVDSEGNPVPIAASTLQVWVKAWESLLVTETSRRKARIELVREQVPSSSGENVVGVEQYRNRFNAS